MGLILFMLHVFMSFLAGKVLVKMKPAILDWSVNKKQVLVIIWFFFNIFLCLGYYSLDPDFSINNYLTRILVTSMLMGMAFYYPLKVQKAIT